MDNFAGQWLELRNLDSIKPDPDRFPDFRRGSARTPCGRRRELFFEAVIREDRSILDFIDGKYTFLNERLAKHYGIPGVTGTEFRRVELDGDRAQRRADAGQRADGDVLSDAHFAGAARQVDSGEHSEHAAAAAAAGRAEL